MPLDGSAVAEAVIRVFFEFAVPLKLEVVLLQVLAPVTPRSATSHNTSSSPLRNGCNRTPRPYLVDSFDLWRRPNLLQPPTCGPAVPPLLQTWR